MRDKTFELLELYESAHTSDLKCEIISVLAKRKLPMSYWVEICSNAGYKNDIDVIKCVAKHNPGFLSLDVLCMIDMDIADFLRLSHSEIKARIEVRQFSKSRINHLLNDISCYKGEIYNANYHKRVEMIKIIVNSLY